MLRGRRGRETLSLIVEVRLPVAGFPGWGVFAALEGSGVPSSRCADRETTPKEGLESGILGG